MTLLLLTSCGGTGTVATHLNDPDFIAQNQPIRVIKIAIVTDVEPDKQLLTEWIRGCGTYAIEQVGIELSAFSFTQAELPSVNDRNERLTAMHKAMQGHNDWDLAVNPASYTVGDVLKALGVIPLSVNQGYIDNTYRRYIVVKSKDCNILIHELFHAFIFSRVHSDKGVMQNRIQLLPFTPAINGTLYLSPDDRKEVLRNKWRNFGDLVEVSHEDGIPDGEK